MKWILGACIFFKILYVGNLLAPKIMKKIFTDIFNKQKHYILQISWASTTLKIHTDRLFLLVMSCTQCAHSSILYLTWAYSNLKNCTHQQKFFNEIMFLLSIRYNVPVNKIWVKFEPTNWVDSKQTSNTLQCMKPILNRVITIECIRMIKYTHKQITIIKYVWK